MNGSSGCDESGVSISSGCSEFIAANYTRVACAIGLKIISELLEKVTGFAVDLDSSTLHGMSYLDVRARFTIKDVIYSSHLLAIPLYERHTGEIMFQELVKFLNALHANWRDTLIGCSTDSARSMTGRIQGLATRI